jgi:hypothetical protein
VIEQSETGEERTQEIKPAQPKGSTEDLDQDIEVQEESNKPNPLRN